MLIINNIIGIMLILIYGVALFFRESVSNEYVFHPINAYHLLKRTSYWLPNIFKLLPNLSNHFARFNMTLLSDEFKRASHGLADLHEYFALKTNDIAKGYLRDETSGNVYLSNSPLNSREVYQIAEEAKKVHYYEGYVNWLDASIKVGKKENQTLEYVKALR